MSHGKFLTDTLSDDDSAIDVSELPSEYRVKLNGFLRSACVDGHETLTRILLDKGADVNYITTNTQLPTALHVAVSNTRERILPILLPQASSATIQAALQYAIQYRTRLAAIIRILQQDGSPIESSDNLDRDSDKTAVESPKKPSDQKESETQTTTPPQKENQTQTNGENHETRQQSDSPPSPSSSSSSTSPPSASSSPPGPIEAVKKEEPKESPLGVNHEDIIKRLEQQLHDQQQQLLEQQHKLRAQEMHQEESQRAAANAQQIAEQAQRDMEEMRVKLQKQEEQIEIQNKQVQQLNEQLAAHETQAQEQAAQLATQVDLTQRLTAQISTQETHTQKLADEVREQLDQIGQLKKRIAELEGENKELGEEFEREKKKNEAATHEFQTQITALQKDIEVKKSSIENISKERDSERKAKEIAKRILSSNGAQRSTVDDMTFGHTNSYAIRMASVMSPTPPDDEIPISPSPSPSPTSPTAASSRTSSWGRSKSSVNGFASTPRGATPDAAAKRSDAPVPRVQGKLSSKSRAKDDMDIASEADRARVRRLVERWEEMKFLEELKSKN
jgi:hypothetical protein